MRRRDLLKGLTAGGIGASLNLPRATAQASATSRPAHSTYPQSWPTWQLDRPKPALANSHFWTWDHSTNWMLDDPGMLNYGCNNEYLKRPETYIEDYRRLTDLAAGLGVKGIIIWGFLRDAHGGIEYAKRVADYATSRGVAIMPGIGTNWYGGVYYRGNHPYNLETFCQTYPEAYRIDENGNRDIHGACPSHPAFVDWLQHSIDWLFNEFAIGGANLENGDFMICHCPKCKEKAAAAGTDEPIFWLHQYLGYQPALQALEPRLRDKIISWATYKGFIPGRNPNGKPDAFLECARPSLIDRLPKEALCQWTLTFMVRQQPLPLSTYLDNGAPSEALSNDAWTADIKPPTARTVGYIHQGTQWFGRSRYHLVISTIKEACLRGYRTGMEAISIQGEVSSMHVPWALNYLAFSHFIHWPEDSLRQFGRKTLGDVLGSADEGEVYVTLLAAWDSHALTKKQKDDLHKRTLSLMHNVYDGKELPNYRFWRWLYAAANNETDPYTASIF